MTDEAWFGVAVVALLAAIGFGMWRWRARLGGDAITAFVLVSTALGGIGGAPFWWFDLPASFAWDLPPVGSRMLAAAALAFGVAGVVVLEHPNPRRIRFYFMLTALYLVPLALAAVFLHLDRFDFTKPVTYGFFAVVVVLSAGSLARMFSARDGVSEIRAGPSPATTAFEAVAGVLLVVWGVILFATPAAAFALVFNWPQDPLTSRLIAAMLVTLGVAFLLSRNDAGLSRVALAFGSVYGLGVAAACLISLAAQKPVPPLYTGVLGLVGLLCVVLLLAKSPAPAPRPRAG